MMYMWPDLVHCSHTMLKYRFRQHQGFIWGAGSKFPPWILSASLRILKNFFGPLPMNMLHFGLHSHTVYATPKHSKNFYCPSSHKFLDESLNIQKLHQYTNSTCVCYCQLIMSAFFCGCFLWLVRHPWVLGWSSIDSGGYWWKATRLQLTTQLSNDVVHWFGYFLCHRASFEVISKCKFMSPPLHGSSPPPTNHPI